VYYLKSNPTTITYYGTKMKSETGPPCVMDSSNLPGDTLVKVTLVARPLLTPVAQKLCRCEYGVFMTTSFCVDFSKKESVRITHEARRN
jgi:hypothetical protein